MKTLITLAALLVSGSLWAENKIGVQHQSLGHLFNRSIFQKNSPTPLIIGITKKESSASASNPGLRFVGGAAVGAIGMGALAGAQGYAAQKLSASIGRHMGHDGFRGWFRYWGSINLGLYGLVLGAMAGAAVGGLVALTSKE